MKILHVTKKYPNALGGDAVVVSNLEKQQKIAGNKVAILTSNCDEIKDGKHIYKFGLKDTPASLDNITIKRLISLIMLFFRAYKVIKTERPDVIHTHSIDMAYFVSFAARKHKVPIVHTFHVVTFNDPRRQGIRSKIELFFLRGTKPSKILVLNPGDIADFVKAGFPDTVFVPNGVNIEEWQVKGPKKKNDKFTFIAVGRLEEQKGFTYLIDAAAKLRKNHEDFQVQIVGEGSLQEELKRRISTLGLDGSVSLLGRKDSKQLRELYAKSDVFVLSSLWEGMPLTLLEAWASGLPTIATDVSSIPYIAKGVSLIVPSQNSKLLAKSMQEIEKDQTLRRKLAGYSKTKVASYSWTQVTREYSNIYEQEL